MSNINSSKEVFLKRIKQATDGYLGKQTCNSIAKSVIDLGIDLETISVILNNHSQYTLSCMLFASSNYIETGHSILGNIIFGSRDSTGVLTTPKFDKTEANAVLIGMVRPTLSPSNYNQLYIYSTTRL
jgi:hypothetical protein